MKVLVTGGCGYVGRVLVARLGRAGHEVTVLSGSGRSLPGVEVVRADLRDRAALAGAVPPDRFDAVCHLAALTRVRDFLADPLATWQVNVAGTLDLVAALGDGTRFVFASTTAVYGPGAPPGVTEDAAPAPANPYAASKVAAEQALAAVAATGALGLVTLRCANAAGAAPGPDGRTLGDPDPTRLVPRALAAVAGGPPLGVNGDGSVVRDYVAVADLARAFELALDAASPGNALTLNAGSGKGASIAEVLDAVGRVAGRPVPVEHRPPADEPPVLTADPGRAVAELGWTAGESGIDEIVAAAWAAEPTHRERP